MPRADAGEDPHRCKRPMASFGLPAAVARPVGKKELEGSEEAKFERTKEWARLRRKKVWDESTVQEWSAVAERARQRKERSELHHSHGSFVRDLRAKGGRTASRRQETEI